MHKAHCVVQTQKTMCTCTEVPCWLISASALTWVQNTLRILLPDRKQTLINLCLLGATFQRRGCDGRKPLQHAGCTGLNFRWETRRLSSPAKEGAVFLRTPVCSEYKHALGSFKRSLVNERKPLFGWMCVSKSHWSDLNESTQQRLMWRKSAPVLQEPLGGPLSAAAIALSVPLSVAEDMRWKINRGNSVSTHRYWRDEVAWRLDSSLSRTAAIWNISRSTVCAKWQLASNHRWQRYVYFPTDQPSSLSLAFSVATQANTKSVSKRRVRCTAVLSVHVWSMN